MEGNTQSVATWCYSPVNDLFRIGKQVAALAGIVIAACRSKAEDEQFVALRTCLKRLFAYAIMT